MKKTCCIVTIIRYDHSYLKEFIDYHSMIGISKFIIYNNGIRIKEDCPNCMIIDYPNCVIIDFPGDVMKRTAYSHFTINLLDTIEEDWVLFIDSNEFLVPKKHITIQKFIEEQLANHSLHASKQLANHSLHASKHKEHNEHNELKSIGIVKKIFSTNGHINKPDNESFLNYTLSKTSSEIQTIIHKDVLKTNIHKKIFDDLNNILNTAKIIDDTEIICINHYLRSWSELIHKIKHHERLQSHRKYDYSEFTENAFSKDCERDMDILKLLSIKNVKEYTIPEDEEEQVNKLLNN
jgi:hypothetical protein